MKLFIEYQYDRGIGDPLPEDHPSMIQQPGRFVTHEFG